MNILTLSTKQKFFDEILAGEKKKEYREIRPNTSSKYIVYIDTSNNQKYKRFEDIPEGESDVYFEPIKYDAIKFLTGEYKGTRPFAIVEVKSAEVQILTNENDEEIVYEYEGSEYIAAQIVYTLGDVIEKSNV